MKLLPARFGHRLVMFVLLLALAGTGAYFLLRSASAPAVAVMSMTASVLKPRKSLLDRGLGALPIWVWRLKDWIVGPSTGISIRATIMELGDTADALSDFRRANALMADTNGLLVWLPGDETLSTLCRRLEMASNCLVVSQLNVTTADGVGTRMSVTTAIVIDGVRTDVGLSLSLAPCVHQHSTDHTTVILLTSAVTNRPAPAIAPDGWLATNTVSIRTNMALAARLHVPDGQGVFLIPELLT